jgi:hypothetical protein
VPISFPNPVLGFTTALKQASSRAEIVRLSVAMALDIAIGFYAFALVVIAVTGGLDLGWLTIRQAAKPILVLWILVPIRLTLYFLPRATGPAERTGAAARGMMRSVADRMPPAVRDVAFAFLVTRLASFSIGFLINLLYPPARARPFDLPFEYAKLAETFAAWDSGWYFDIATRGYYYSADGQSSIAFFPLYPMAMRAFAWPFGSSEAAVWAAGIAISCAAFFLGLLVLHGLTERMCGDREIARRTVLYVSVFPFSFFLARVYPSGLFFLLTVLAVSTAHRSRWWLAGVCGGLAALTRPQGVLIAIPLGLMALKGTRPRESLTRLVAMAPIPLAFIGYNVYIGSLAGHPLAWLASEGQWGFSLGHPPWEQLLGLIAKLERYGLYDYFFTSNLAAYRLFHGAAALFLLGTIPAVFTRLGTPLGLYVLVSVLVPLSGNALEGIGRYGAVLFPVFMVLGMVKSPRFHEALLIIWAVFLALFVGLFATWHPIY